MKKIIRLTESDLTKIVNKVILENKNSVRIYDILEKTNLYKLLDKITKVKYVNGTYPNNDRGGLRLLIHNDNDEVEYNFSINGYNVSKAKEFLHYLIKTNYLNGQTLKELKSIDRKTSYGLNQLIDFIITDIINKPPTTDEYEV